VKGFNGLKVQKFRSSEAQRFRGSEVSVPKDCLKRGKWRLQN